jgi:hypothetical protein
MRADRRGAVVLLACAALAPRAVGARIRRNIRLRMEGYLGPPPAGRSEQADLTLRAGGADHRFQVTKATVLSGNALAADVFDRVRPYEPNFNLRGPKELLDRVAKASPGARLVLSGTWIGGATRDFLLASVETPQP